MAHAMTDDLFQDETSLGLQQALDLIANAKFPDPDKHRLDFRDAMHRLIEYDESLYSSDLPSYVPEKEWAAFARSRRINGKPMTKRAMHQKWNEIRLKVEQGHDAAAALEQSAKRGWQGLWWPDTPAHSVSGEFPS